MVLEAGRDEETASSVFRCRPDGIDSVLELLLVMCLRAKRGETEVSPCNKDTFIVYSIATKEMLKYSINTSLATVRTDVSTITAPNDFSTTNFFIYHVLQLLCCVCPLT
jgi:hypothetical protein